MRKLVLSLLSLGLIASIIACDRGDRMPADSPSMPGQELRVEHKKVDADPSN